MTALHAAVSQQKAFFISDGAITNRHGKRSWFNRKKVWLYPEKKMAIGGMGCFQIVRAVVRGLAQQVNSFDEFKTNGTRLFRVGIENAASIPSVQKYYGGSLYDCDIVCIGWSEKLEKPEVLFLTANPNKSDFKRYDVFSFDRYLAHANSEQEMQFAKSVC